MRIGKEASDKIANVQFLLSMLVVLIHSGSYVVNLPQGRVSIYGRNFATYLQLFFTEGVCRVAVPLFFVISGFLFFATYRQSWQGYRGKLGRRLRSLVIPYVFWSGLVFLAFYIVQRIPGMRGYFTSRDTADLGLGGILRAVLLESYDSPLWFCRYLVVLAALAPLIHGLAKRCPRGTLLFLLLSWLGVFPWTARPEAFLFYFLGACLASHPDQALAFRKRLDADSRVCVCVCVCWLLVLAVRTWHLCGLEPRVLLEGLPDRGLDLSMKLSIVLGIVAFWGGYDHLVGKGLRGRWRLADFSFLVFVVHHPVVGVLKKLYPRILGTGQAALLGNFLLSAATAVLGIVAAGMLMRRLVPGFYGVIVGNRSSGPRCRDAAEG